MNRKWILGILALVVVGLLVKVYWRTSQSGESIETPPRTTAQSDTPSPPNEDAFSVPAHYESPPANLGATLAPEKFAGKTREAYQAARDIPRTLAQLPCYCHCDRGMGHKSLHSCFEDEHAAHCAICTDEALMAYRLQRGEGLSAAKIRERIIAKYSNQ